MTEHQKCLRGLIVYVGMAMVAAGSVATFAQTTLDGDERDWKVTGVQLERVKPLACHRDLAVYSQHDTDQDGVLDDVCIGMEYDPCDIHSAQINMIRNTMAGLCRTLEDEARDAACTDGLTPRPKDC